MQHRVKIYKTYANNERTPYKWRTECTCGYVVLSWSWSREWEAETQYSSREEYVKDNGLPIGGALPIALVHIKLCHSLDNPHSP